MYWTFFCETLAAAGLLTGAALTYRLRCEISQRKAAEAALKAGQESLDAANTERIRLMQIASHDLRNPLTALLTSVSLLAKEPDFSRESSQWLDILRESATRIEHLLQTILDFETIQSGRYTLDCANVPIRATLEKVVARHASIAGRKGIELETSEEHPGACVIADAHAFERILDNVVFDALKLSQIGSRLLVRTAVSGGRIRIAITGKGAGDSHPAALHLFEHLSEMPICDEQRLDPDIWIVRKLTEMQNGRLWWKPGVGQCPNVLIDLPRADHG